LQGILSGLNSKEYSKIFYAKEAMRLYSSKWDLLLIKVLLSNNKNEKEFAETFCEITNAFLVKRFKEINSSHSLIMVLKAFKKTDKKIQVKMYPLIN